MTDISEELIETICTEIKRGVPYKYASRIAGVSEQTVYKWRKKGEAEPDDSDSLYRRLYDEFERAKALAVAYRVESIRKAGEINWTASAWWLERVAHEDFGRKSVIDANVNANVEDKNLANLFSKEKIKRILDEDTEDSEE